VQWFDGRFGRLIHPTDFRQQGTLAWSVWQRAADIRLDIFIIPIVKVSSNYFWATNPWTNGTMKRALEKRFLKKRMIGQGIWSRAWHCRWYVHSSYKGMAYQGNQSNRHARNLGTNRKRSAKSNRNEYVHYSAGSPNLSTSANEAKREFQSYSQLLYYC
jgi:hypothetical protein